ncbi:mechanosensitive ion channel protein MscS [Pseudomonas alcaligenes]|uniref:Small-conductance mechanosensitive channel n=1 Tax=Aquipseudomonas alcaligenes TaxID=43263 RepID=A0ABR7RUT0_AQUAC|nr:mechanosensitive ion channel domain-containing protein [Pseudomonas alcaligenes]MBC9248783.1 mechanosensitive ion channel protein MscS [Pseudomonas alcaligenes]
MAKLLCAVLLGWIAALPGLSLAEPVPLVAQTAEQPAVELKIANRSIMLFRASLLGEAPKQRVHRAEQVIRDVLADMDEPAVRIEPIHDSYVVLLGDQRAFFVTPQDLDPLLYPSAQTMAQAAADNLRLVVSETHEGRNLQLMLRALLFSAIATSVYALLLAAIAYARRRLLERLPHLLHRHNLAVKLGQTPLIDTRQLYPVITRLFWGLRWLLILLLSYEWLSFVLSQFPYTRPWGENLNSYLQEVALYLLNNTVDAVPGLVIAAIIFVLARAASSFSRSLLRRLASPGPTRNWLTQETLQPTMRLTALAIWLFALAMAYPYLPGAGTEAFKGLSVLVGLMISLGASSVVGQAAAGLILTYSHTFRAGEYVRIGEYEGTVSEVGMFNTRIRTGLGEELTLPNSLITGSVTKNYSRAVEGQGYIVDTVVTIGYDTPWRQVEAMLIEAALRTPGISDKTAPRVFQTALSDFYPEYHLVALALPTQPRPRAELLSQLHANIQDVFNQYGVQIMSPHYLGDPKDAKWVPREHWYAAPAKPAEQPPGD